MRRRRRSRSGSRSRPPRERARRSEEHTSELQSRQYLVCRLLLEKKKNNLGALPQYLRQTGASTFLLTIRDLPYRAVDADYSPLGRLPYQLAGEGRYDAQL